MLSRQEALIYRQGVLRVDLIGMDKIIKGATLNVENTSSANGKLKFVLTVLFIYSDAFIHKLL
jgi:hypothetical protein